MHDNVTAFPKARGGEFFAVDKGTCESACNTGLNPAVAYLTVARGCRRLERVAPDRGRQGFRGFCKEAVQ